MKGSLHVASTKKAELIVDRDFPSARWTSGSTVRSSSISGGPSTAESMSRGIPRRTSAAFAGT